MMNERADVIEFLTATKKKMPAYVEHGFVELLYPTFTFINSMFCNCKYVEYWCLDLNFGQNTTDTEMGMELRGLDTIEKFVDFLYERRASNATKINLEVFQHHA